MNLSSSGAYTGDRPSDDDSLPDGSTTKVAGLVISFVDAFNSGIRRVCPRTFSCPRCPSPPDFAERGYDPCPGTP